MLLQRMRTARFPFVAWGVASAMIHDDARAPPLVACTGVRRMRVCVCTAALGFEAFAVTLLAAPTCPQKLDAEQLEELREAFNLFDTDGNGE